MHRGWNISTCSDKQTKLFMRQIILVLITGSSLYAVGAFDFWSQNPYSRREECGYFENVHSHSWVCKENKVCRRSCVGVSYCCTEENWRCSVQLEVKAEVFSKFYLSGLQYLLIVHNPGASHHDLPWVEEPRLCKIWTRATVSAWSC